MTENGSPLRMLLVGEGTTPEAAAEFVRSMRGCAYLATASASERLVVAAFVLPECGRLWLEGLEQRPDLAGLKRLQLTPYLSRETSSPWSRGEVSPTGALPCGECCATCPADENSFKGNTASPFRVEETEAAAD
jgi:hypothetical protein